MVQPRCSNREFGWSAHRARIVELARSRSGAEAYGTHMPLANQLATVSVPEARLISVQVWDKSMVHAVEKRSLTANLGLTPSTEGRVIRLRIPGTELSGPAQGIGQKSRTGYAETARVAVRHARRDGLDLLKKMEKGRRHQRRRPEAHG